MTWYNYRYGDVIPDCNKSKSFPPSQNTNFFSVPRHTPVILAESVDCGTTMMRFLCGDAGGNHETRQLNSHCPIWIMDIVCQVNLCL